MNRDIGTTRDRICRRRANRGFRGLLAAGIDSPIWGHSGGILGLLTLVDCLAYARAPDSFSCMGRILSGRLLSVLQKPGQLIGESTFFALGMKLGVANRCGIWDKRLTEAGKQAHNRKDKQCDPRSDSLPITD